MKEKSLFGQMSFWRNFTVQLVRSTPEDLVDEVPEGFLNSIRWNTGHILVVNDEYISMGIGRDKRLPDFYHTLFATGTRSSDWNEDPPSMDDLLQWLEAEPRYLQELLSGRVNEELLKPAEYETTFEELICFLIGHETYHLGVMHGIKRAIGIPNILGQSE
ncbi:DinB family protein [Lentibacillus sediminis]|uniref:DinB family protein n=1 Tax=Lentibacillus sediminis TaxID=1940529 RepID=UPI000C1C2568|nr:DinB family protein [Lentibacillus sediminis]